MKIYVTWGTGEGKTEIAAFDNALWDAGIANYNLIKMSSVIPTGSEVVVRKLNRNFEEIGHKLYVVMSGCYEKREGEKVIAGLGWVSSNHTGNGIFVEGCGNGKKDVYEYIKKTISSMSFRGDKKHGKVNVKFAESVCKGNVTCALVVAVYRSEGW